VSYIDFSQVAMPDGRTLWDWVQALTPGEKKEVVCPFAGSTVGSAILTRPGYPRNGYRESLFSLAEATMYRNTYGWAKNTTTLKSGAFKQTAHNLKMIFESDDELFGGIAYDQRRTKFVDEEDGLLSVVAFVELVSEKYGLEYSSPRIMEKISDKKVPWGFDPVAARLDSLSWDGIERLDTFLRDHAQADDTVLNKVYSRRFMIGAVARAFNHGCQMDTMMVLTGAQGTRKSTLARALAFDMDDWFYGYEYKTGKDNLIDLDGPWIVEWAELANIKKSSVESMKKFITERDDQFRAPYEKETEHHPRKCVFVGTTNNNDFLADNTGNRRFWIVDVQKKIDIEAFIAVRDQLWAEAVSYYKAGEVWWLTDAEEKLSAEKTTGFEQDVPESETILMFGRDNKSFSLKDLMVHLKLYYPSKLAHKQHYAGVLTKLGFRKHKRLYAGRKVWRWYTPQDVLDAEVPADISPFDPKGKVEADRKNKTKS